MNTVTHPQLKRVTMNHTQLKTALLPAALTLAATALLWPTFAHAFEVWSTVEEFSYGYFILPISVALVWWRRDVLKNAVGAGSAWGLPIVLVSLVVYLSGWRAGIHAISGLAAIPLLWGMTIFLWGWRVGQVLAFPLGFLAFGLGVYRGLLNTVGFAMQDVTAIGAGELGRALGLGVVRDGLVLQTDRWAFIVAEACSGMSSLVSLLALATLWIYVARASLSRRLAILLSVAPLVLLANTIRVTSVLMVASWFGQDAALGFFHGASSLVLFCLALASLLAFSRIIGCSTPNLSL
jgi:exosortase